MRFFSHPVGRRGPRVAASVALALASFGSQASVVLTNASFESIGSQFSPVIGGLFAPSGWTVLSGLPIQSSSALPGFESISAGGVTGDRFLRLASDAGAGNIGFIAQDMGTMVAGERYEIVGDVLGGDSTNSSWAATFSLTSDLNLNPTIVYSTQHLTGVGLGVNIANAFSLSYLATASDEGKNLFMWIRADASATGTARRGGVDNLRLTVTPARMDVPEPGSLLLAGLALAMCGATWRKRPS